MSICTIYREHLRRVETGYVQKFTNFYTLYLIVASSMRADSLELYELSNISDMGGDVFIHGKSATIGCIPIGDEAIEEVFVLTQKAINNNS